MTWALQNRSRETTPTRPSPTVQRTGTLGNQATLRRLTVQRQCAACEDEDKGAMQRKATANGPEPDAVPDEVHAALAGSGRPLDTETRAFMEPRFGQDFSGVRVHTGPQAEAAARSINARAFTAGGNLVFGAGEYSPRTDAGRRLLSHELTHVVQQGSGIALKSGVGPVDDVHERQADRVSDAIAAGGSAAGLLSGGSASAASGAIQRQTPPLAPITPQPPPPPAPTQAPAPAAPAKPTCAATHTIPDDIYNGIDEAWKKAGHGGATVTEHGGMVVTDSTGARRIRKTTGTSGSVNYPTQAGDTNLAAYHTHPYSTSEGSHLGVGFSGDDITNLIQGNRGKTTYVGAGSCYFAMDTLIPADRDACKSVDTTKRWNDAYARATGTMQEKVETAIKAEIVGCGLCYYKACRPDAKSAVPKTLNLQ